MHALELDINSVISNFVLIQLAYIHIHWCCELMFFYYVDRLLFKIKLLLSIGVSFLQTFSPLIVNKCVVCEDFTARKSYIALSPFKFNDLGVSGVQAEALKQHRERIF